MTKEKEKNGMFMVKRDSSKGFAFGNYSGRKRMCLTAGNRSY